MLGYLLISKKLFSISGSTSHLIRRRFFVSKYKLYLSSGEELLRGLKQEYQSLEAEKMEEDNDTEVMEKSNCAIGCCTISMVQN